VDENTGSYTKGIDESRAWFQWLNLAATGSVVVRAGHSDDWKALVPNQGGDPVRPAFSGLDQRVTSLDASLFGGTAAQ
jgi:hypothetical protein